MSRNFGLGSRDMKDAGRMALNGGMQSFSSIATMSARWSLFVDYIRQEYGIGRMERVGKEMVLTYGALLAEAVEDGEKSAQTAQTYLCAINRVFEIARGDRMLWVSPTKDCGIARRSGIATENRAINPDARHDWRVKVSERIGALIDLQYAFGLRFEESAKLDPRRALAEIWRYCRVTISDGTKGGLTRSVPIISKRFQMQLCALERAAAIQGKDRSMIPADQSYVHFRRLAYREAYAAGIRFHSQRHAYAQERYVSLVGAPCPVDAGRDH